MCCSANRAAVSQFGGEVNDGLHGKVIKFIDLFLFCITRHVLWYLFVKFFPEVHSGSECRAVADMRCGFRMRREALLQEQVVDSHGLVGWHRFCRAGVGVQYSCHAGSSCMKPRLQRDHATIAQMRSSAADRYVAHSRLECGVHAGFQ